MLVGVGRPGRIGRTQARRLAPTLLTSGSAFGAAAWVKSATGAGVLPVVEADAVLGPDGTMTADRVTFNLGGGATSGDRSLLTQSGAGLLTAARVYRGRVFGRVASGNAAMLMRHVANAGYGVLNLTTTWQPFDRNETAATTALIFDLGLRGGFGASDSVVVELWGAELRAA